MIENPKSARVKKVAALARKKDRLAGGLFLVEGPQAVRELLLHRAPQAQDVPAAAPAGAGRGGVRGGSADGGRQRPSAPLGLSVQIAYSTDRAQGDIRLGDDWRVRPSDDLLAALRAEFTGSVVEIVY